MESNKSIDMRYELKKSCHILSLLVHFGVSPYTSDIPLYVLSDSAIVHVLQRRNLSRTQELI